MLPLGNKQVRKLKTVGNKYSGLPKTLGQKLFTVDNKPAPVHRLDADAPIQIATGSDSQFIPLGLHKSHKAHKSILEKKHRK
jgi:hypothetical protein